MYTKYERKCYKKEWIEERKSKGVCVKCGERNDNPDSSWYCKSCIKLKTKYHRDFSNRRKADGLCVCCGLPNDNTPKVNCKKCSLEKSRYSRERYRGMTEDEWHKHKLTLGGISYANQEALEEAKKERKRLSNLLYQRRKNGTDPNKPINYRRGHCIAIEVVDARTLEVIDTYESQSEMAKDLGISQTYASILARSEKAIEGIYYRRKEVTQ
ncbi:MAG: hypothetical protein ACRCX8_01315 [Sarcina sp.]